jgi:hypothetical protein
VHHVHGYISSITLWVAAFYRYSLIASVYIGMFCNQHHLNYSDNKLWAEMFRTSFINLLCYLHLLSISFVMNVADIYHPHVVISILWELDHLSFFSLVKLIYVQSLHVLVILISSCSRHQPQSSLVWLLPVIFWFVFCFSSLKSLSSESRDEILFRRGGCDSSCTCNTRYILLVWNMCLLSVKLVCVCVKLLKI